MKVLVYFQPKKNFNNFEGARLRKTIKGALEMSGVEYTTSIVDTYNVVHLISPNDEKIMDEAIEYRIPVVVSALYTEDDPSASYIEETIKDGSKKVSLAPKALKFLNKATLVLVPCEENIQFLQDNGVTAPIKVNRVGVNLSRFDFSRDDEKSIFYRYYRENSTKKLVIGIGEYVPSMNGINAFITAANKCPNDLFYYVGRIKKSVEFSLRFKKFLTTVPKNVHFVTDMPDDVYRSALLNATVFMIPGYRASGIISIYEAMAAKCQIIARKSSCYNGILKEGETAHVCEFSETLSSLTKDCLLGKIKPTITKAYEEIQQYPLEVYGNSLKEIYNELINNIGGKNHD